MKNVGLEAVRGPWLKRVFGYADAYIRDIDIGWSNNYMQRVRNAANTGDIDMIGVDSDDKVRIGGATQNAFRDTINLPIPLNADNIDQCIFIAPYAMRITAIREIHATAGSDAGAVTLNLTKDASGVVPGAGSSLMSGTLDMKGTAATLQTATLTADKSILTLAAGDRIGANFVGVITALAGVVVTIDVIPGAKGNCVVFRQEEMGVADCCFFIANRPLQISRIDYVHSTLGTDAGAVNLQVTKDVSTNAPGAGTDILTNNANAGFNCKAAINVVQNGALAAAAATLLLAAGDRLSVDFAGTTTALAGVVVVVTFTASYDDLKDITLVAKANADAIDQYIFIADRSYRIVDARYVNAVAGTDGGAVNAQLTVDDGTDAPGAGVDVLSNNSSAGFNAKGTADTVEVATFISEAVRYMLAGNRLSLDMAGVTTTLAGIVITVTVQRA